MGKIREKLSPKEFSKLMYFMYSFTYIFQASLLLLWGTFSSEHSFKGCLYVKEIIAIIVKNTMSSPIDVIPLKVMYYKTG